MLSGEKPSIGEQTEAGRVLPQDFVLPDLAKPSNEKYFWVVKQDVDLDYKGHKWTGRITYEMNPENSDSFGGIRIEIFDPSNLQSRISNFHSNLSRKSPFLDGTHNDIKGPLCLVFHRIVEDASLRRKGIGELSMLVLEEVLKKINAQYPDMKMDKIVLETKIGALGRLLVKLGYGPYATDKENAESILQNNIDDEFAKIDNGGQSAVFVKNLGS